MAVVLWAAAIVLLGVSTALGQDQPALWMRIAIALAQCAGLLLVVAATLYTARTWLLRWAEAKLLQVTGPAMIRSMPPRAVLGALLPRMYGEPLSHPEIFTGILGGAGRDAGAGDTAVSSETFAHMKIETVSDTESVSSLTTWHEYSDIHNHHLLIIFATADRDFARLVMTERIYPLYELWLMDDEESVEEFIPTLREKLRIGVRYTDQNNTTHDVAPKPYHGEEVAFRQYDTYLRIPEHLDRKDLRIIRVDLHELADDDHVVTSVKKLVMTSSNVESVDQGYLMWSPPHPCFVRSVTFDLTDLGRPGEDLVYMVVFATIKGAGLANRWAPVRDHIEVPVSSWMLPGHNVTLLYRPSTTAELPHAPQPDRAAGRPRGVRHTR